MTNSTPPTALKNLQRFTKIRLIVVSVIAVLAIILNGLLVFFTRTQITKYQSSLLELKSQYLSTEGISQLQNIVNQHQEEAQALIDTFPQESTFPQVIAEIEAIIGTIDPTGQVNFSSDKPVRESGELYIPLIAHFNGTIYQVFDFMRQIEKLPYIIEITGIEIKNNGGLNAPADVRLNLKVYVQDPFTSTK